MGVQPSQHRSRDKRERLLTAAIELLAEGGARAITHHAVAGRAGVAPAATTYYFESIQDLTDQALALHVSLRTDEFRGIVERALARGDSPVEVSDALAASLVDRGEEAMVAQFEVYLEAWRNPALRAPVSEALGTFEAMATAALRELGVAQPEAYAPAFLAAVDGFALHRVARPRPHAEELASLLLTFRALFIAAVMGAKDQAHWDERLALSLPTRG